MEIRKERAAQPEVVAARVTTQKLNPKSKRAKVLRCFLERGERGLNCFQAVELCRDYVLRTTVSEIQRYLGIRFNKKWDKFKNSGGGQTEFICYSLSPEGTAKARQLLTEAGAA